MKLEPNRTTLAEAKRESPAPQRPPALSVAPAPIRKCSACGAEDIVHRITNNREANDELVEEHSVTIDIRFVKSAAELTPRLKNKGWRGPKTFQGRMAIERFICRRCLLGLREMEREHKRKLSAEKNQSTGDSYYMAVCGE